jgi:hypothetical protein
MKMNKLQKMVVALLILSVVLSVISVSIDFYVIKSAQVKSPELSIVPVISDSSGEVKFYVEESDGG